MGRGWWLGRERGTLAGFHTIIASMAKAARKPPHSADDTRSQLWRANHAILMPENPNKDQKSRLGFYIDWLSARGLAWYQPDLNAYRDYLLHQRTRQRKDGTSVAATLSPQTTKAHLATIRGRYDQLTRSNDTRDRLYELANPADSEAEQRALVDEFFIRMLNDLHPSAAPVKLIVKQDIADSAHLRLKPYQVSALVQAPGIASLRGLRDTALIALMVCSGMRAAEAAALHVNDLRQHLGGELSLRVRAGKGGQAAAYTLWSA